MPRPVHVLAVSGTLRAGSSNTAALIALARLAPDGVGVTLWDGLRAIPPFDPDQDGEALPPPVAAWRAAVAAADALVISSPEYARGIAGALKNALDWLVSGPEFPGKPVGLVNTSPRAVHALAALRLVLETMSGVVDESACVTLPLLGAGTVTAEGIMADPAQRAALLAVLDVLATRVASRAAGGQ